MIALIVSGGHTMLLLMKSFSDYKVIGQTVDDAAGEAFDKVARLLRLPYPGGPNISHLARTGKPVVDFPRPMLDSGNYNFSFSGLKTAVRYYLESLPTKNYQLPTADIARSFEDAVVDVLVQKTMRASKKYKAKTVSLGGGVAANRRLREALAKSCKQSGINFLMAPQELCTDNAGMIAIAAYFRLRDKYRPIDPAKIKADPGWELS